MNATLRKALVVIGLIVFVLAIVVGEAIVLTRWQHTVMQYQDVKYRRDQMASRLSPINVSFDKDNQVVLHLSSGEEYHTKTIRLNGKAPGFTEVWDGWQSAVPIDAHTAVGAILEKSGKFAEAKAAYMEAMKQTQALAAAAEAEAAKCPTADERKLFLILSDQARDKALRITQLLQSDAIRLGADGYVLFEGKWMKPDEVKEIEDRRRKEAELVFEKAQIDRGLAKVDGKWVTKAEAEKIGQEKFVAEQKKRGFVLYKDKWVKREEMETAEAAVRAKKEKEAAAAAAALERSPFAPTKREWLLDDFKNAVPWQPEAWADLVSVDVAADKGVNWMSILYPGGPFSKTCLTMPLPKALDLSSRARLLMDLNNTGQKPTNISIMVTADLSYETKPYDIPPGEHKDFAIPIAGKIFKCPIDNWQKFAFAISRPQAVTRIGLMVNAKAQQLLVTRVRLVAD